MQINKKKKRQMIIIDIKNNEAKVDCFVLFFFFPSS